MPIDPRPRSADPWLRRTAQVWKLGVFLFLISIALTLFGVLVLAINDVYVSKTLDSVDLAFVFVGVGLGAVLWLLLALRCPNCGYRPVWGILRTADASTWLIDLWTMARCPRCSQ